MRLDKKCEQAKQKLAIINRTELSSFLAAIAKGQSIEIWSMLIANGKWMCIKASIIDVVKIHFAALAKFELNEMNEQSSGNEFN